MTKYWIRRQNGRRQEAITRNASDELIDGLILRWYPSSGSLTLNGDNADKVKAQLLQLMEAGYENVDDLSQDGGRMACDVEEEASMQNIEECDMDKNINHQIGIDLHSEPIQANPLGEISSSILKHIENIENKIEKSLASFDKDLRELKAITELSMEIGASQSLSENVKLQDEIICLRDKVIDQSYLISELQAKFENVVNERNSLLTTLHIIQGKNNLHGTSKVYCS